MKSHAFSCQRNTYTSCHDEVFSKETLFYINIYYIYERCQSVGFLHDSRLFALWFLNNMKSSRFIPYERMIVHI